MLPLAEIQPGQALVGLEPGVVATVVAVARTTDTAVEVFYKTPDGVPKTRLLYPADEAALATAERSWSFDGDGPRANWRARPCASTLRSCSTR